MIFLIWAICLGVASTLMVVIQRGAGVQLSPLLSTIIAGTAVAIAISLTKRYKRSQAENTAEQQNERQPSLQDADAKDEPTDTPTQDCAETAESSLMHDNE